MGFPRQEYWSGLLFLSPRDFPDPGIKPASPRLAGSFSTESTGKPLPSHGPIYVSRDLPILDIYLLFFMEQPTWVISPQSVSIFLQSFYTHPWCGWTMNYSTISYRYRCISSLLLCCYITEFHWIALCRHHLAFLLLQIWELFLEVNCWVKQ